jgi:formylglycine-generating enzyme required for sulfatase activity
LNHIVKLKKEISNDDNHNYLPGMVFVKGGCFNMGSNEGAQDERPVHEVCVDDFYIGKYEVTQKQWESIIGSNPSFFSTCDFAPVENISLNIIKDFIKELNHRTGRKFRLPTEAEWEYASRGGNLSKGYKYSGSDSIDEVAWYDKNSERKTHPIGLKKPNELGIYDMSGNVWEYCADGFVHNYYNISPRNNPRAFNKDFDFAVIRGGSWFYTDSFCRNTCRHKNNRINSDMTIGFRLALTP